MLEILAVFLPLAGAVLAGFGKPVLGDRGAEIVASLLVGAACVCSIALLFIHAGGPGPADGATPIRLASWIDSGRLELDWALQFDALTAIMVFVVTTVSAMVHVYAIGYMSHDRDRARFMAYLSLFTFAMLMLVTADNFLQMFFGWEGVGLVSYLLIGFWNERASANAAAIKAFLVNRVGDIGFVLGIFAVFVLFDSVRFADVFAPDAIARVVATHGEGALTVACLLLFVGAMGKSAQLGLHTWLPDAMEGPTPVSALIHAATMVTAGIFMLARCSPLFAAAPDAMDVVAIVGALTAFVAATIGLTQFDIKRVIAYSTMSQLGYMFFALGVGAWGAAIFHLVTHAFFKALLFLGAGSVIHALEGEQDMRRMGGLWKTIPITYGLMWVGSLALAGIGIPAVFGFAGFYSKDLILESAYGAGGFVGSFAFWMGIAAAFLTAFYSARLLFLTFHGTYRGDPHALEHAHESPPVMLLPLMPLAFGALFAGAIGLPILAGGGHGSHGDAHAAHETLPVVGTPSAGVPASEPAPGHGAASAGHGEATHGQTAGDAGHSEAAGPAFWGTALDPSNAASLEAAHSVPGWVPVLPLLVALAGIALAWVVYIRRPGTEEKAAAAAPGLHALFFRKWYFDELYQALFVRPVQALGRLFWKGGDVGTIDRLGPDGVAAATRGAAKALSKVQTGYVYHYAFAMLIGVVLLVGWYWLGR